MTHVLACALYCNSDGSLNSGGQFIVDAVLWGGGVFVGLSLLAATLGALANLGKSGTGRTRLPREPVDASPFTAALLSGQSQPAYTSRYRAVTPRGVLVSGKCCYRGHRSPGLAVAHAQAVSARIARTGR